MLAGYKPSYPQATVDNCAKNPVDNAPAAFQRLAGGGRAGGEGPRSRYPREHFYFYFPRNELTLPHAYLQKRPSTAPGKHAGV